jgi:outer membrane protein OmpA-like peptidoglycan-associated protein
MKKLFFLLIAAGCSASAMAQKINADAPSPRWAIDINLLGGLASQTFKTANTNANYPDAVTVTTGELKYNKGYSFGADAQLGFFFGKKRHFGIGAGIMFMEQHGVAELNNFHTDSRAVDAAGNVFRQVLLGNDVREDITSSMVNIPVVLKYKDRFSKHWGFSADAGALINMQMRNSYVSHASFDQESIYRFVHNPDGGTTAVYDNSPTPSADSWLITKAEFLQNNPNGNWAEYAAIKRSMGMNVGEKMLTGNRSGNNTFKTASVGFIIRPTINYYLSDNVSLNFGGYYMMQPFKSDAQPGYRLTDGNGSYSSVLNNVTASTNHAYGLNVGARFLLGKKDRDHDGVADRKDACPDVFGLAEFDGCPDTDKDGIPDSKDSCATVWGLALFNGCPDTDGDGIEDKLDECPTVAGLKELNGCPDRDHDGITDKKDLCPDKFGLAEFHGCPDTDGDGVPDNEDNCPMVAGTKENNGCPAGTSTKNDDADVPGRVDIGTPIMFEVNLSTIHQVSMPVIEEAVLELNENKGATVIIDGHADASGPEAFNNELSLQRANAVKTQLTQRGINPARVKTIGHGSRDPIATNSTYEGKEQNRRAKMKIKGVK